MHTHADSLHGPAMKTLPHSEGGQIDPTIDDHSGFENDKKMATELAASATPSARTPQDGAIRTFQPSSGGAQEGGLKQYGSSTIAIGNKNDSVGGGGVDPAIQGGGIRVGSNEFTARIGSGKKLDPNNR